MSKIIDLTKVVDQSFALESGIQFKESGIPLTIRIQNPSSIEKKKKNRNQYVLDYLQRFRDNFAKITVHRKRFSITEYYRQKADHWAQLSITLLRWRKCILT